MNENEKNIRKNFLKFIESRYMKFVGGNDLAFSLIALILLGIVVLIFEKVSYVFDPLIIIFKMIAAPIIVSLILFYLSNPTVNTMGRYRVSGVAGIFIIYLAVAGVIALIVNLLIPIVDSQVDSLVKNSPQYLEELINSIGKIASNTFFSSYYSQISDWLNSLSKKIPSMLSEFTDGFGSKIATPAETIANIGVVVVITSFVLFFVLKDGHHFRELSTNIMPPKFRKDSHDLLEKMSAQVGSYIQGQIIVSFCIGILSFTGYSVIRLKYSLVLASIAAVTSVVPYLRPTIVISPTIIIATIIPPWMLLKLAVVWTLVQFVEGHLISPDTMGKTLKIHSLTTIFILLCAGKLLGIVGTILGISGYAVLKVLVTHLFQLLKRRYNRFYGNDIGEYDIKKSNKIVE